MAQENIDFGSFPNDPDADAIRTAFQKVQNNFTEVYTMTVSTGVVSLQPGTGITLNQPQGNIVVTANLHSITVQTGANLRVGISTPTGSSATITNGSTPFVIDLANTINVGNVIAVNLSGRLTGNSNAQPNITSLGNLTRLRVVGNLDGSTINANDFIGGTFTGNFTSPGSNTQIIYNKNGFMGASGNLTWDETLFKVVGDIEANNIQAETVTANLLYGNIVDASQPNITTVGNLLNLVVIGDINSGNAYLGNVAVANFFIGNGAGLTGVLFAESANFANNLIGGPEGALVFQKDVDDTDFLIPGPAGHALISNFTSGPEWVSGTISGVQLGDNLHTLELGDWLTTNPAANRFYDGSLPIRVDVDGDTGATPNTVVVRDSSGNVFASWFIGNLSGGLTSSVNSLNIPGGNPGDVLTTDGTGKLSWARAGGSGSGVAAAGNDTEVQFNDKGVLAGNANFHWTKATETLFSSFYSGNGNGLSHIWGPNVVDWVPQAIMAKNLVGGTGGVIPFQEQPNVTGFTEVGTLNDALLSTGTGKPKWVPATISGIYLNNNLFNLSAGEFLIGKTYNGNLPQEWKVNASPLSTPDVIVSRNSTGSFAANVITGNAFISTEVIDSTTPLTGAVTIAGGLGVLGNINSNTNVTAKNFFGNFIGNFEGKFTVNAPAGAVLYMDNANVVKFNTVLKFDESQNSLIAPIFRGNGAGLSDIIGANVTGVVANAGHALLADKANFIEVANRANHISDGTAGAIVYQTAANNTGFASGKQGQVLISGGAGQPTWANGTISGIALGQDLLDLTIGAGLIPLGKYNGSKGVSIAVDSDVAATASKIVMRDSAGNINAGNASLGNAVTANYFIGDLKGSLVGGFKPSSGNGVNDGVTFPANPGGGAGDLAYVRYFSYSGDDTVLELGVSNDSKDYINLNATGGVGVNKPAGKTDGVALDVNGNILASNANIIGEVKAATFKGDGAGITGVLKAATADTIAGVNVTGKVANAIYADTTGASLSATNLNGGVFGSIPYQSGISTTAMLAPGAADAVIVSGGPGAAPKFVGGTISGAKLGTNLKNLANGKYMTGGLYNGSGDITFAVDATPSNTPEKIVARDASSNFSAGNITAVKFIGNLEGNLVGGVKGSVVFQRDISNTGFLAAGTTGQVLMWDGTTTLPKWNDISLASLKNGLKTLTTGYGLAGGIPGYNGTGDITFTVDATPLALPKTVANRDAGGNIYMNTCYAIGLHAGATTNNGLITGNWKLAAGSKMMSTYSDLAEYYAADQQIEAGTVVEFGGDKEITISNSIMTTRVAGVVATAPAYIMNSDIDAQFPAAIALQGRVPVKVAGTIRKGDIMVSAGNGEAMACSQPVMGSVIGKSLENFDGAHGVIEVAVGRL
jgi:hypothetical protein